MPHGVSRIKVVVPQPVHCKMCLRADISEMICICTFNKLVECPCIATGVDFLNAEKEYTRTNHDANQITNRIPTV